MNIDWSKAPEGATHYRESVRTFYKQDARAYEWDTVEWRVIANDLGEFRWCSALIERPVTAWNGEGLPPVGTVCELRAHKLTDWSMAKIEFAHRNVIVWDWIGEPSMNGLCTTYAHNVEMRPIRTPEQIAAEDREQELNRMVATISILDKGWARKACAGLYDAGYRKQVAP